MKVIIYKAKDGWRWRIRSRNGRIMADGGEAYTRQQSAERAVKTLLDGWVKR